MNWEEKFEKDPSSVGFCTFEEYRKNPDKWRFKTDQLLTSLDDGIRNEKLKQQIAGTKFFMEGYRCDSIEKVEALATDMGVPRKEIVVGGIVREKTDNGKFYLNIHMMSKSNYEKRKTW